MDEPTGAAGAADAAAEAVRALNHLTIRPPAPTTRGWEDLADVYAVIGSLRVLLDRLPQALDQVARAIERPGVGYASDNDDQPAVLAARTVGHLHQGAANLTAVRAALEGAHGALSHLYVERHLAAVDGEAGE
jgi:hypothetical protein